MPLFRIHSSYPVALIQASDQSVAEAYYLDNVELAGPTFSVEVLDEPIVVDDDGCEIEK